MPDAPLLKIIYLGDIVGNPGRLAFAQLVPKLKETHGAHMVIVNAENAANGTGLTPEGYRKVVEAGADGITLGDHVYKKVQIRSVLEKEANICRPANLPAAAAGRGYMRLQSMINGRPGPPVYVIPVLGRIFMNIPGNDPFACVEHIISHISEPNAVIIVEIHAEATSEKIAMGWKFNGRVAAVLGTHTHVPTADTRVLPADPHAPYVDPLKEGSSGGAASGGTAFQADLGMCGPLSSVLGRRVDRVLTQMTTAMPAPFDVADHDASVQGVVLTVNPLTQRAVGIERINMRADMSKPPFAAE